MDAPSPSMRDLATRLLALEAASGAPDHAQEATRVCERLRVSMMRFAGAEGFVALLRRALVLARAEFPELQNVRIGAEGRMEVLDQGGAPAANLGAEAAAAIAAHLLGLLATFIGEPLTLRLMREAWPDEPLTK